MWVDNPIITVPVIFNENYGEMNEMAKHHLKKNFNRENENFITINVPLFLEVRDFMFFPTNNY
jgi:hypothetical protein